MPFDLIQRLIASPRAVVPSLDNLDRPIHFQTRQEPAGFDAPAVIEVGGKILDPVGDVVFTVRANHDLGAINKWLRLQMNGETMTDLTGAKTELIFSSGGTVCPLLNSLPSDVIQIVVPAAEFRSKIDNDLPVQTFELQMANINNTQQSCQGNNFIELFVDYIGNGLEIDADPSYLEWLTLNDSQVNGGGRVVRDKPIDLKFDRLTNALVGESRDELRKYTICGFQSIELTDVDGDVVSSLVLHTTGEVGGYIVSFTVMGACSQE